MNIAGDQLMVVLTGLEEFVQYNISVRANTAVGSGPYSAPESATTFEDGKGYSAHTLQLTVQFCI